MAEVAPVACHSEANGRGISPGRQGCLLWEILRFAQDDNIGRLFSRPNGCILPNMGV